MNTWLFFSILAPFFWGTTNVLDAAIRRNYIKDDWSIAWFVSVFKIPVVFVVIYLFGWQWPSNINGIFMLIAGILLVAPLFLYYRALHFEDPSRIALFIQIVPVFTLIIAYGLIGEKLSAVQGIGFIFIFLGSLFAAMKLANKKWHFSGAYYLILLAGVAWALSDVVFKKFEPSFENYFGAFAVMYAGSILLAPALMVTKKQRKKLLSQYKNLPKSGYGFMVLNEIFGVAGDVSFTYALTLGKASLTSVIMGSMPLFAFGMGFVLSRLFSVVKAESIEKSGLIFKAVALIFMLVGLWYLN